MQAMPLHPYPAPHPSPGMPRFRGDWVDAAVVLGHGTIRVDTAEQGHILLPEDFETLSAALRMPAAGRSAVQFNAALGMLLVPGGHDRVGRSFFPVRPAGAQTG
ncbi:hypothetical protein [Arthrobacter sp.]|uniref:hypothetical protein n=1 Tax=Arthrobacter sp. TaxID=1667 RepID=UPI003A905E05